MESSHRKEGFTSDDMKYHFQVSRELQPPKWCKQEDSQRNWDTVPTSIRRLYKESTARCVSVLRVENINKKSALMASLGNICQVRKQRPT